MQRRLFLLGLSAALAASCTSVLAQEDEEEGQIDASAAPPSDAVQTHESEASPSDVDPNAARPQGVAPTDLPPPIDDAAAGSAPPPVIHAAPIPPQPAVSCTACTPPCPPPTCQPCGRSRRRLLGRRRCR